MNLFETITDKIIATIKAGEATESIAWAGQGAAGGMPVNLKTGKAYSGVNVLLLWAMTHEKGYTSKYWLTFKQAKELGGNVKKGEKATTGVFWGSREIEEEGDNGETEMRKAGFAKAFYVFNLDQIEGLTAPAAIPQGNEWTAHEQAETLIKASGARIIEGGTKAFYSPSADDIHMPDRDRFACADNFYAVNLHELTHWTGHATRCARDLKNRFGDEAYAMEELIAELGAAFLCAETGIGGRIEGHASYIKSWLKVLKSDPRAIVTAASKASAAARFLIDGPAAAHQLAA
jgi:antirestriction protein ArdC